MLQKNNTRDSNVVPHRSTNRARWCLTSQSGRDAVLSSWYGRSCPYSRVVRIHTTHNTQKLYKRYELHTRKIITVFLQIDNFYRTWYYTAVQVLVPKFVIRARSTCTCTRYQYFENMNKHFESEPAVRLLVLQVVLVQVQACINLNRKYGECMYCMYKYSGYRLVVQVRVALVSIVRLSLSTVLHQCIILKSLWTWHYTYKKLNLHFWTNSTVQYSTSTRYRP